MTTKDAAPVRAIPDDGPELAAIAVQVRPVVDAGKARQCGLEAVRSTITVIVLRAASPSTWFAAALDAIGQWLTCALDIDAGRFVPMHNSKGAPPMTLSHVALIADRIASQAFCQAPWGQPVPDERWIVHDLAVALRRACGCSALSRREILDAAAMLEPHINAGLAGRPDVKSRNTAVRAAAEVHDATVDTLLPLLIRDVRRMLAVRVEESEST